LTEEKKSKRTRTSNQKTANTDASLTPKIPTKTSSQINDFGTTIRKLTFSANSNETEDDFQSDSILESSSSSPPALTPSPTHSKTSRKLVSSNEISKATRSSSKSIPPSSSSSHPKKNNETKET